jgi:hypothetical protein
LAILGVSDERADPSDERTPNADWQPRPGDIAPGCVEASAAASAGSSNCTSRGHFKMYRPERSRMVAIVG